MVDVSEKEASKRSATAQGCIYIPKIAFDLLQKGLEKLEDESQRHLPDKSDATHHERKSRGKGDVLAVAQLAGIMASKRTADLIPLCHSLPLSHVAVRLAIDDEVSNRPGEPSSRPEGTHCILCTATVTCEGKTGVEMEALTAVSVSLLTVWDMLKAVAGRDMVIGDIFVTDKRGGKSGDFSRRQT